MLFFNLTAPQQCPYPLKGLDLSLSVEQPRAANVSQKVLVVGTNTPPVPRGSLATRNEYASRQAHQGAAVPGPPSTAGGHLSSLHHDLLAAIERGPGVTR